jgi:glycosyltransferase involved in cell wall biosynthesis
MMGRGRCTTHDMSGAPACIGSAEIPFMTRHQPDPPDADRTSHHRRADAFAITPLRNFGAGSLHRTLKTWARPLAPDWAFIHQQAAPGLRQARFTRVILCTQGQARTVSPRPSSWPDEVIFVASESSLAGEAAPPFIRSHLSDPGRLAALEAILTAVEGPQFFMLADALELLRDPRPLLRVLRRFLRRHSANRVLIATPDRNGRPGQTPLQHIREWNSVELAGFLASAGFQLLDITIGKRTDQSSTTDLILAELGCDPDHYANFLADQALPTSSRHLILVAENADRRRTPDIRHYAAAVGRLADERPLVLALSDHGPGDALDAAAWSGTEIEPGNAPEAALAALLHLLFIYDELEMIHCSDEAGLFFRVAQAKRAGLLPPATSFRVVCLGSSLLGERSAAHFQGPEKNYTHLCEKLTIELADDVIFPTRFIQSLYLSHLRLTLMGQQRVQRLPYSFSAAPATQTAQAVDTLILLGDTPTASGWNEFQTALRLLSEDTPEKDGSAAFGIRRLILTVPQEEASNLPPGIHLENIEVDSTALHAFLLDAAPRSLVVFVASESNHPYSLLQAVDANCQILAVASGGIPELIPEEFHPSVLCARGVKGLVDGILRSLSIPIADRMRCNAGLKLAMARIQSDLNRTFLDTLDKTLSPDLQDIPGEESPVTVVIPVYDRPLNEIEDVIYGLNAQSLPPHEVIFVDDGSSTDFALAYGEQIQASLHAPARFIRHTTNMGLAAARNTGVMAVETAFAVVHDSDNIACNDFLFRGCTALNRNPEAHVATFWLQTFADGEDWSVNDEGRQHYRPISDGLILSLTANYLGDAMAVYRTSILRQLGGWDETDRSMWEDWALYLRMLGVGIRILNVPRVEVMYRVRADSMLRTYPEYDARIRIARSLIGLSMFEALSLERVALAPPKEVVIHATYHWRLHLVLAGVELLKDRPRLMRTAKVLFKMSRSVFRIAVGFDWRRPLSEARCSAETESNQGRLRRSTKRPDSKQDQRTTEGS